MESRHNLTIKKSIPSRYRKYTNQMLRVRQSILWFGSILHLVTFKTKYFTNWSVHTKQPADNEQLQSLLNCLAVNGHSSGLYDKTDITRNLK